MMQRLVLLALALLPVAARAQGDPTLAPPPPPPPGPSGLAEDPNIDRAWFSPTAATQPKGTVSFNDYELIFLGITYGVTDNFQLTAVVLPPFTDDIPFLGMISGKGSLEIAPRVRIAASVALAFGSVDGDSGTAGVVGGALSYCTDESCASLVSGYVYGGFSLEGEDGAVPVAYGASLVQRLGRRVKLVVDVGSGGVLASEDAVFAEGILLGYGLRFFTSDIAGDIGFVRPFFLGDNDEDIGFILGLPVVTFSYRW